MIVFCALVLLFLCSFAYGRYPVPLPDVIRILGNRVFHLPFTVVSDRNMEIAVINVRLPRILLACMVGSSLSLAGCAYQSVFQNPMAAPDILGASSGAGFGAALAILLGLSSHRVTLFAFCFSILSLFLVYLIGSHVRANRTVGLLLAGIMIGSLFSAGLSYLKLVADPNNQLPVITYWLMGSLSGATHGDVWFAVLPMLLGTSVLLVLRWRVNLLTLHPDEARAMGVHTEYLRLLVIGAATLLTATSVASAGMIGWVGLVIPNLCRKLIGNDNRYLFIASALFGASFLLLVDDVSRNLLATEIPIGILTAFIGAPFFLYLMTRRENN
ncbi:MAG: iron ABC transporter permease [Lachnospiraceae bacterium]|nr:iron ABC transporter permease [Lachnospiraceae bacterium]